MFSKELFHVDPITIVVLVAGFIGTWTALKKDSRWHTEWIQKHDQECKEHKEDLNKLLTTMQITNEHLATISVQQEKRLDRLEEAVSR